MASGTFAACSQRYVVPLEIRRDGIWDDVQYDERKNGGKGRGKKEKKRKGKKKEKKRIIFDKMNNKRQQYHKIKPQIPDL